jgi:Spy/CpxP family protein refolding chaperone
MLLSMFVPQFPAKFLDVFHAVSGFSGICLSPCFLFGITFVDTMPCQIGDRSMQKFLAATLFSATLLLTVHGTLSQEPKQPEPKAQAKFKGQIPMYWGQIGLSDEQKQKIYAIQAKHNTEIDKLEQQIKSIKETMNKERLEILTPDQKKRLEDIIKSKIGG